MYLRHLPLALLAAVWSCTTPTTTPPAVVVSSTPAPLASTPAPSSTWSVEQAWGRVCTGPASVPMEIAGGREFVQVTLTGKNQTAETLRFHVDTGGNTPGVMILRSAVQRLGFTSEDELPQALRIADRTIALPEGSRWVIVDDPIDSIDRRARKNFSVGQLGAGFLSRFLVCIDPAKKRLGLMEPHRASIDPTNATWIRLLLTTGGANRALYPFVHVLLLNRGEFAGGYGLLLDTGATTSMLDRNKIDYQRKANPHWPTYDGAAGDADMIGGAWSEGVLQSPDTALHTIGKNGDQEVRLSVGPAVFVDRPTGTWSKMFGDVRQTMGSHGAVANDVLLRYRLLIDYEQARLYLQPSGLGREPSASPIRVGVSIAFNDEGCPFIRQIATRNHATTHQTLRVGDTLHEIDGKDACQLWHHEIVALLASETAGTPRRLKLVRGQQTMDVQILTADLLAPPSPVP